MFSGAVSPAQAVIGPGRQGSAASYCVAQVGDVAGDGRWRRRSAGWPGRVWHSLWPMRPGKLRLVVETIVRARSLRPSVSTGPPRQAAQLAGPMMQPASANDLPQRLARLVTRSRSASTSVGGRDNERVHGHFLAGQDLGRPPRSPWSCRPCTSRCTRGRASRPTAPGPAPVARRMRTGHGRFEPAASNVSTFWYVASASEATGVNGLSVRLRT